MPTQDERLLIVEQTLAILRNDFLQAIVSNTSSLGAINKVLAQQEVNTRDADHAITILLGVVAAQGKEIKDIRSRLDGFDQRFTSVEERFASVEERFASVDGKLDQILLVLGTLTPKTGQET